MATIYKYPVPITDECTISVPKGARFLCVQLQHDTPQLWAMVNQEEPAEERVLRVIGTGHDIPDAENLRYIDTFQYRQGQLVFHVFEKLSYMDVFVKGLIG